MVTHPSRVLENISVSFLDANASLYWDNTFPVKAFTIFWEKFALIGVKIAKTCTIQWNSKLSDKFRMTNGVRQGTVTSLF